MRVAVCYENEIVSQHFAAFPPASPGRNKGLPRLDEVGQNGPRLVPHQGSAGQGDAQVLPVRAVLHRAPAVSGMASLKTPVELEVGQVLS